MNKKRLNKRAGSKELWRNLIFIIITLIVGILFFVILKDRIGGLLHF